MMKAWHLAEQARGIRINQPDKLADDGSHPASGQILILRSEEHTSELQSHSEISYAVFCLDRKSVV